MFEKPKPGSVVTYTAVHYSGLPNEKTITEEKVNVVKSAKWDNPNTFRIKRSSKWNPAGVIELKNVTDLYIDGKPAKQVDEQQDQNITIEGSGNKKYTVTIEDGEPKYCTCPGFKYRGSCRHLKEAANKIKQKNQEHNQGGSNMAKLKSVSNMNWSERLALIDHFSPDEDSACQVFDVTKEQLQTAYELRQAGSLKPCEHIDVTDYNTLFDNTTTRTTTQTQTAHTTSKQSDAEKNKRKGSNKITKAFEAVPYDKVSAQEFAEQYGVSLAVLRQSKRFDPYSQELGPVHVKKDKQANQLMVWREAD